MAKTVYSQQESKNHGYYGIALTTEEIETHFPHEVLNKLKDAEGTFDLVSTFSNSLSLTGFVASEILTEIFTISSTNTEWRVGEAFAEFFLESHEGARFYWNEIRDQRNINSNKTGADLVGFIDLEGNIVFLFGEIKTSNDPSHPPQVLYGQTGMIKQLEDLLDENQKVFALIRYLGTKAVLYGATHPFRKDYESALKNFMDDQSNFYLFGILVRDTSPDERDLKSRYKRLKAKIDKLPGLQLKALYIPVKQEQWVTIVNSGNE